MCKHQGWRLVLSCEGHGEPSLCRSLSSHTARAPSLSVSLSVYTGTGLLALHALAEHGGTKALEHTEALIRRFIGIRSELITLLIYLFFRLPCRFAVLAIDGLGVGNGGSRKTVR